jgi:hypothetical protein
MGILFACYLVREQVVVPYFSFYYEKYCFDFAERRGSYIIMRLY